MKSYIVTIHEWEDGKITNASVYTFADEALAEPFRTGTRSKAISLVLSDLNDRKEKGNV